MAAARRFRGRPGPAMFVAAALRSYVLRRLTFMLLVIWAASTLTFLLPRMLGLTAIESRFSLPVQGSARVSDARRAIAEQYRFGFDRPLWSQYVRHLDRLVRFDLGYSTRYDPVTVMEILRGSVLWTLGLLAVTTIIAFGLGTVLGALLGWPGSPGWAQAAFLPVFALSAIPYRGGIPFALVGTRYRGEHGAGSPPPHRRT